MNKADFYKFIEEKKIVVLDGATGTELAKRGMSLSDSESLWVSQHMEVATEVKASYINAGSNLIYAPTFSCNREKLKAFGLEDKMEELIMPSIQAAKNAAENHFKSTGGKILVAGDIGMTGVMLEPFGDFEYDELVDVYKEQIALLDKAGCDLLVVETIMNLEEMEAALEAAQSISTLPVMATMTFEANGRTLYGTTPEDAALSMIEHGAAAVGANCSTGPDKMLAVIEKMASVSTVPIIAKPNAGLPVPNPDGSFSYNVSPEEFVEQIKCILGAGATLVGGCCGTNPEYIKKLSQYIRQ